MPPDASRDIIRVERLRDASAGPDQPAEGGSEPDLPLGTGLPLGNQARGLAFA
jgi:hypothetical protein